MASAKAEVGEVFVEGLVDIVDGKTPKALFGLAVGCWVVLAQCRRSFEGFGKE